MTITRKVHEKMKLVSLKLSSKKIVAAAVLFIILFI